MAHRSSRDKADLEELEDSVHSLSSIGHALAMHIFRDAQRAGPELQLKVVVRPGRGTVERPIRKWICFEGPYGDKYGCVPIWG
jgi:hypothetical protein